VLGVLAPNRVTCTVQVNVPCLAGVPRWFASQVLSP
jgi:hypothetical protein